MSANETLKSLGMTVPEILLPREGIDLNKWAVIACDQYTSEKDYWENCAAHTAGSPSTLNLIFPECYLQDGDGEKRIASIHEEMNKYREEGVFAPPLKGFILIKREAPGVEPRWGLVTALDLDAYDFNPASASLIRATEGTILDRIPPRKKIRQNAPLELPHIMVLLDDPDGLVIEAVRQRVVDNFPPLYDFNLMFEAGRLTGYGVTGEEDLNALARSLKKLWEQGKTKAPAGKAPLLYAVGDGNHSLATAKSIWEDTKATLSPEERENHPARYALVELVNLYDRGITFEPIHRVLFGTEGAGTLKAMEEALGPFSPLRDDKAVSAAVKNAPADAPVVGIAFEGIRGIITLRDPQVLPTAQVQDWLDEYLKGGAVEDIDYIHGDQATFSLGDKPRAFGILLPAIEKDNFFATILDRGVFPRKTFSMGEAREKRFYMEAREIL
jgi:hypothetical protein